MARVVMDPEVRRNEIIDVASELFNKKGYEQTAISDIVKKANVAQGTFYYYFESKDDVLNAIIERWITEIKKALEQIVENRKMNALQKFFNALLENGKISRKHQGMANYVHDKKNELFHLRLMRRTKLTVAPFLEKIIQQGIQEGTFHTQYPKEAAMAFLAISDFLGHELRSTQEETNRQLMYAIIDFTERILITEQGTVLRIYESWQREMQKQIQN